jgi:hypothetical protein
MVVQKEIDLKALQSVLEDAMQNAIDNCEEVRINLIVAHDVIAVIKEEHKREIQDKLKPIPLPSCIGKYDENKARCTRCKQQKECMEEKERNEWNVVEEIKPECHGHYCHKGSYCFECKSRKSCIEHTINKKNK